MENRKLDNVEKFRTVRHRKFNVYNYTYMNIKDKPEDEWNTNFDTDVISRKYNTMNKAKFNTMTQPNKSLRNDALFITKDDKYNTMTKNKDNVKHEKQNSIVSISKTSYKSIENEQEDSLDSETGIPTMSSLKAIHMKTPRQALKVTVPYALSIRKFDSTHYCNTDHLAQLLQVNLNTYFHTTVELISKRLNNLYKYHIRYHDQLINVIYSVDFSNYDDIKNIPLKNMTERYIEYIIYYMIKTDDIAKYLWDKKCYHDTESENINKLKDITLFPLKILDAFLDSYNFFLSIISLNSIYYDIFQTVRFQFFKYIQFWMIPSENYIIKSTIALEKMSYGRKKLRFILMTKEELICYSLRIVPLRTNNIVSSINKEWIIPYSTIQHCDIQQGETDNKQAKYGCMSLYIQNIEIIEPVEIKPIYCHIEETSLLLKSTVMVVPIDNFTLPLTINIGCNSTCHITFRNQFKDQNLDDVVNIEMKIDSLQQFIIYKNNPEKEIEPGYLYFGQEIDDPNVSIFVFNHIINLIDKFGLLTVGVYRIPGSQTSIDDLKKIANTDIIKFLNDISQCDVTIVASLLKLYLRELKTALIIPSIELQFIKLINDKEMNNKEKLNNIFTQMSENKKAILKKLMIHLSKVVSNKNVNMMGISNIGRVFGPNLFNEDKVENSVNSFKNMASMMLIRNAIVEKIIYAFMEE
ncbi:hypothetical protein A3Q56_03231 [Intoshia linei]|uniref:Rho-GAP domain-containing protein n=1 Tax=Intoshia linei TaxID=1819745 RepID=A0A177B3U8_9BILA|nr:hypothetical protein A3Q56_03231 [Intoshia linei]